MCTGIQRETTDQPGRPGDSPGGRFGQARPAKLVLSLVLVALLGCAAVPFVGATTSSHPSESHPTGSGGIHDGEQPPYARTPWGGDRVTLVNSDEATNPSWAQLLSLLWADETDQNEYDRLTFPCGAFAEEFHNSAEAHGIRAAWVVIHFEGDAQSHALNVFETTDHGLVWIDCSPSPFELSSAFSSAAGSDKAAYVAVGEEYNLVGLAAAADVEYAHHLECLKGNLDRSRCSGLCSDRPTDGGGLSACLTTQERSERLVEYVDSLEFPTEWLGGVGSLPSPYANSLGTVSRVEVYW